MEAGHADSTRAGLRQLLFNIKEILAISNAHLVTRDRTELFLDAQCSEPSRCTEMDIDDDFWKLLKMK